MLPSSLLYNHVDKLLRLNLENDLNGKKLKDEVNIKRKSPSRLFEIWLN